MNTNTAPQALPTDDTPFTFRDYREKIAPELTRLRTDVVQLFGCVLTLTRAIQVEASLRRHASGEAHAATQLEQLAGVLDDRLGEIRDAVADSGLTAGLGLLRLLGPLTRAQEVTLAALLGENPGEAA